MGTASDWLGSLDHLIEEREPDVQALLSEDGRMDRLRSEARFVDEKYPDPDRRPELFGKLVGVKDIFHVGGFPTRAGSRLPPEVLQGDEAESVRLLKGAGALILGKTVTTEFAYFAPGPTRNPHNLAHTPGGSSSGSAAAVAAGFCPLALGTQTIGSISRPAAFCGVVGYKPSYERISRAGVIPLSPSLDHVGLLARDVSTARAAARLLCVDWREVSAAGRPVLGVPEGPYLEKADEIGLVHFELIRKVLENAGFEVRAIPVMEDFGEIEARHRVILLAEAARVHQSWFAKYAERYHPKTAALIEQGQAIDTDALAAALPGRGALRERLTGQMAGAGVDIWISPPAPGPAPRGLSSTGDPIMNLPWTHCGLPTLTIPAGRTSAGLPMGLQLAAGWLQDELLFDWADQLARAIAASALLGDRLPGAETFDQISG